MTMKRLSLQSCRKKYTYDQDKACSPTETVHRFHQRLKATKLDILKEVKRIDNGRLDIPVYFSVCGTDAEKMIGNKKQMGKGSTPEQSRASACMELGERFSFFSFVQNAENFLVGDYKTMEDAGHAVLPLPILLKSVHDETLDHEALRELLTGLPMLWTWATRLSDMESILIPFSWFYAINEFNGPSAGNTYEEAVMQGICEIIERHVCAIITKDHVSTPSIDLDSIHDPVAVNLIEKFKANNIELRLNDFSLDTGIPTIGALAWDPQTFPEKSEIVYTAGTTPDATKAVIRALTEVAQLAGDFNSNSNYVASGLPKPLQLEEVEHVLKGSKQIDLADIADVDDSDMYQEIKNCIAAVRKMDTDIYVIDTTHPELDIPALYTIIPGAHFRERAMGGNGAMFAAKLASQLLEAQDLTDKLISMEQVLPTAYYLKFYRGRDAYNNGDLIQALDNFNQALELDPNEEDIPYIYSYKGSCLRDMGLYAEAIEALRKGLAADEERPDMHNIMGVCHYKCDQYDQAVHHFRRAVALNPVSAIDYANLALNLEKTGQREEAIEQYQVALGQDPSIEFAMQRLEKLLQESKEA
ncbi:YcaO-like family protein [Desulfogranum marinum]|uniref:YcaO-like family protein n=1 Tax=Desulfogranum marinum TaxID=453220 RepID=UPI001965D94F|nr:YcaO-like family protein [Desulfogranum marinum]MBM9511606.1 YcaO-like family protein [Desulfogranum marinum]